MISHPHSRPGNDRLVTATELGHLMAQVKKVLGLRVVIDEAISEPKVESSNHDFVLRIPRQRLSSIPGIPELEARIAKLEQQAAQRLQGDPYAG